MEVVAASVHVGCQSSGLLKTLSGVCAGMCGWSGRLDVTQVAKAAARPRLSTPALQLLQMTPLHRCVSIDSPLPELLPFFRGTGRDSCGRKLSELRAMDFHSMEKVHNYIQWMFPTDEASKFNRDAPSLTPELQRAFAEDPALAQELRNNLARFCEFLGLEMRVDVDDNTVVIAEAPHFFERWQDCWKGSYGRNHNWMRISRVLMCLGRCSLLKEQQAFSTCLEKLYADGVPCGSAIGFWREKSQTRPVPVAAGR